MVGLAVPDAPFLLDPLARIGAKMLLNALSTCTMVRLGRVLGNRMICLVPSNLKLIDRSTRYIRDLAGVSYEDACRALFEVIDFVEPRRRAGRAYPAPVGVATMRLRHGLSLEEAESRLAQELG
jgi:N-acetylmuramic acid 6-phosphate (MurNAc-6-P) etherase